MTSETAAEQGQQQEPERLVNSLDRAFLADPYPALAALRAHGPVYNEPFLNRYWLTRHDDVDAVTKSPECSSDPRKAAEGSFSRLAAARRSRNDMEPSILALDPPDHTRLRGLVSKAFTPRAVEAVRPRAQEIADALLDPVAGQEGFDLVDVFAAPFPTIVIAEILGVDPADQRQFKIWTDTVVSAFDPFLSPEARARVEEAADALTAYFERVIAERRASPREDLISRLIAVRDAGDRLTEREMITMLRLLLNAGNVTTTDLISNGVLALLEHPDQMEILRADPALLPNAVEEMLRYDSPVVQTGRVTLTDTVIGSCPISKGQSLSPSLAAANRDPEVYPDPDRFDVTREDTHHHSFGGGVHYCLGAPLARLEGQVAIGTLLRRFPRLRLNPDASLVRRTVPAFRGLTALPVLIS